MRWSEIKNAPAADVYRQDVRVGSIARTVRGAVFEYDADWLNLLNAAGSGVGIAYNMPASQARYEVFGVNLHTFFAGLLPEGLRLRSLTSRLKTSEDDLLSLLIAAGPGCIGDVSVVLPGQPAGAGIPTVDVRAIGEESFPELFERSVSYTGDDGPSAECSIPGLQDKISAAMISFPVKAPKGSGSYILKLNPAGKPRLVENEHFFLRMARACGLAVPGARLVRDRDGVVGLLVERFDRVVDPVARRWVRVHQEDACQFLDRYPADKYRLRCSEIAEGLIGLCSAPIVEIARFLRLVAFCYLIGNGDLHAKNISIRTRLDTGRVELTPAYDLLTTLVYGDQRMALQFEGRDDNLERSHFLRFGERCGVRAEATLSMLDELCARSVRFDEELDAIGLEPRKTAHLRRVVNKRRRDLAGS